MSEGEVLHPFVIDKALPDKFGYAKAFLQKQLVWDFAATSGGGRHTAASVRDLMAEMGDHAQRIGYGRKTDSVGDPLPPPL